MTPIIHTPNTNGLFTSKCKIEPTSKKNMYHYIHADRRTDWHCSNWSIDYNIFSYETTAIFTSDTSQKKIRKTKTSKKTTKV